MSVADSKKTDEGAHLSDGQVVARSIDVRVHVGELEPERYLCDQSCFKQSTCETTHVEVC